MKILHTTKGLLKRGGGPAYTVPALAMAQARHGARVHILLDEDEYDYEQPVGVQVSHRSQLSGSLAGYLSGFDVVHDHGVWLPCNHRVAVASRKAGVPRVISPRGALQDWVWNQRRWKKELGWFFYQKSDLLTADAVFATAFIEADQVKKLGFPGPIFELSNGVDQPGSIARHSLTSPKTILFLARIHPKKGIEELIECWCDLAPQGWRLLIAGNDELGMIPHLQERLGQCKSPIDVHFLGMVQGREKVEAFNQADLFVLPTHSENFGVSVIEAMLMALPVLTTTGTPWRNIENDGIGWLIEPGVDTLRACLSRILGMQREDLSAMGLRAQNWANGRFSWDGIACKSLELYQGLCRKGGV